jgi:hypothetical protein
MKKIKSRSKENFFARHIGLDGTGPAVAGNDLLDDSLRFFLARGKINSHGKAASDCQFGDGRAYSTAGAGHDKSGPLFFRRGWLSMVSTLMDITL